MKSSKKTVVTIALSLLLLIMVINEGAYAEDSDLGSCELALYRCLYDPLNLGTSDGAFHCLLGYLFCKKYLDRI